MMGEWWKNDERILNYVYFSIFKEHPNRPLCGSQTVTSHRWHNTQGGGHTPFPI